MRGRLAAALPAAIGLGFAALVLWGLSLDPIDASLRDSLKPPSVSHPFGTDHLGRDILARVAHGFALDILLAASIVGLSSAAGLAIGVAAAEFAGRLDDALTFVMDVLTALPQLVIALILAVYLGGGVLSLVVALTLSGWVKYARIARAAALSLREEDFMSAARMTGCSRAQVLTRHIAPHILPMMSGLIALQFGHAILNIAALGFIGVGVQPPTPELGAMIAEARPYFVRAPWLAVIPGVFLFALTALALMAARLYARRRNAKFGDMLVA